MCLGRKELPQETFMRLETQKETVGREPRVSSVRPPNHSDVTRGPAWWRSAQSPRGTVPQPS